MRAFALFLFVIIFWAHAVAEPVQIRMMAGQGYGIPPKEATNPRLVARRAVFEQFHKLNPDVRVVNAGGLELTGERAESMFLMSMAGANPPDVFYVNFRQYYNYIDQGFCLPLDDYVKSTPGVLKNANPTVLKVVESYDGHIYAIPWFQVALGLYYRKDHFKEAGLDPSRPPRTWDEFLEYSKKLTESKSGRNGFIFSKPPGYHWSNFVFQAGGKIVDIDANGQTRSVVSSPAGEQALEFFRRLTVDTWKNSKGETVGPAATPSTNFGEDIRNGKASMWFDYSGDVITSMTTTDVSPSLIGMAAMPKGPVSASHEVNAGMWAINANIKDPKKIAACWKFIQFFTSDEATRVNTERFVEMGMANLVNPRWLKKFGYSEYLGEVDPSYVAANENLFKSGHPEPYGRNTQQVYLVLDEALDRARLEPNRSAKSILDQTQSEMNAKLLGYIDPEVLAVRRGWATGIASVLGAFIFAIVARAWKRRKRMTGGFNVQNMTSKDQSAARRFVFVCLLPATGSLLLWMYYPLSRGLLIAFQDYRITKGATWVGLDNFISVFTQPIFWKALGNSFLYVGLSIGIGFFIPIFLALALNEIPRAKVLFRTLFYLPAMTSGIVIALLWRQFYDKSDAGLLNQIIQPFVWMINNWFIRNPENFWPLTYDWLGSPQLAMFSVVLPAVWAGAGPGSILYLAALKNIPEERYEAADLDGANWMQKIRSIILPGLKPLILINLLGVFIGGFKAMENIFVLTMGGPLNSTQTIGLEVWMNAFMFLKFGYATAAAWVMGAILIGFTVMQIKNLLRMRFTTSKV